MSSAFLSGLGVGGAFAALLGIHFGVASSSFRLVQLAFELFFSLSILVLIVESFSFSDPQDFVASIWWRRSPRKPPDKFRVHGLPQSVRLLSC